MIRAIVLLLIIIFTSSAGYAREKHEFPIAENAKPISIIYIHGANATEESFSGVVKAVHYHMVKQIQNDPLMYDRVLALGQKKINKEPIIFYWANKRENNLKSIEKALDYVKNVGSKIAQFGRKKLSHSLHDLIWISKPSNNTPLVNALNEKVKIEAKKGNEVILYGYSAGSLLVIEYLNRKMPIININKIRRTDEDSYISKNFVDIVQKYEFQPTCIDALKTSKILFYTHNNEFVSNPDIAYLSKTIPQLDEYTKNYCAPQNTVKGFVLFGTPLTIFESSSQQQGSKSNVLSKLALRHIIENNIFFLVLNYENDFIGMPLSVKPQFKNLKKLKFMKNVKQNGGFIYDGSGEKCGVNVISAHNAYWSNGKRFAKSIVKIYNTGYLYFYAD